MKQVELTLRNRKTFEVVLILFALKICLFLSIFLLLQAFGATLTFTPGVPTAYDLYRHALIPAVLETFFAQYFVLDVLSRYIKNRSQLILLSAFVFAIGHYQNFFYILYEFPMGIFYAIAYIIFKERGEKAYLIVALIHFVWNTVVLMT